MTVRMYITRADKPSDSSDNPIPLQAWRDLVLEAKGMHLFEGNESLPPHVTPPESPGEGLARWAGHPRLNTVWFHYKDGLIYTDGYDAYVVNRMRALALRLGARVRADSGAIY